MIEYFVGICKSRDLNVNENKSKLNEFGGRKYWCVKSVFSSLSILDLCLMNQPQLELNTA